MNVEREEWAERLREHWPVLIGVAVIVVGHIWLYGIQGYDWSPASPPVLVAIVVVIILEVIRSLYSEWQES